MSNQSIKSAFERMWQHTTAAIDEKKISWNELEDRPFGETVVYGDTLTWDGNTDGLVSVDGVLFKVSDAIITKEDCANGLSVTVAGGTITASGEDVQASFADDGFMFAEYIAFVPTDNYYFANIELTFPEAGVYFMNMEGVVITELVIPNYTDFAKTEVKKLDSKYLEPFDVVEGNLYKEVFPKTTVSMSYNTGCYQCGVNSFLLTPNKTYVVEYDGVEYSQKCNTISLNGITIVYLGNLKIPSDLGIGDYATEYLDCPFCIIDINGGIVLYADMKSSGDNNLIHNVEHTFRIYIASEVNKTKLKVECLPEGYPYKAVELIEILPETTVDFSESEEQVFATEFELVEGKAYTVTWNGVEYNCVAKSWAEGGTVMMITVGDLSMVTGEGESTGEPFIIGACTEAGVSAIGVPSIVVALDGSTSATFFIGGEAEVIHKIDNKYLEPFDVIDKEEEIILSETEINNFTLDANLHRYSFDMPFTLEDGITYNVVWDGESYELVGKTILIYNSIPCTYIGNRSIGYFIANEEDTEEPFCITTIINEGEIICIASAMQSDGESHTVSIVASEFYKCTLKKECMLDGYLTETELNNKGYLTETELNNKGYLTETELNNKGYASVNHTHNEYAPKNSPSFGGRVSQGLFRLAYGDYSHAEGEGYSFQIDIEAEANSTIGNYTARNGYSYPSIDDVIKMRDGSYRRVIAVDTDAKTLEVDVPFSTDGSSTLFYVDNYKYCSIGRDSHAEGYCTTSVGMGSHAEGRCVIANGDFSHAEGDYTVANGDFSHAEGSYTVANGDFSHVEGKYNIADNDNKYAHIVGNGTNNITCSNAHTIDWDGNAWFAGDVYVGSTSGTNKDDGSVKLIKNGDKELILSSSTEGSTKKFKITVDDNGILTATEV